MLWGIRLLWQNARVSISLSRNLAIKGLTAPERVGQLDHAARPCGDLLKVTLSYSTLKDGQEVIVGNSLA